MSKVLWSILTHQSAKKVAKMLSYWRDLLEEEIIILYGGCASEFTMIPWEKKVLIDDPWLLTKDHQRERQSYCGVYQSLYEFLEPTKYSHVFFTEYDQIPLRSDLADFLLHRLKSQDADVLFHGLRRIDKTNNAHWLNEQFHGNLSECVQKFSNRSDTDIVLSSYGFGQFWTMEAFLGVANFVDPPRVYLELWIPTVAYHMGYRLGDMLESDSKNQPHGKILTSLEMLRNEGNYLVHPIKEYW